MILPESYYGPGSYNKWIRVGWALKNTSEKLFLTFLKFSSQSNCRRSLRNPETDSFDWNQVGELVDIWNSFANNNSDGLTKRSIMYWAKQENLAKYTEVRKETIDFFIDETLQQATEYDLATVLFNIFKDNFVCVSIKQEMWYEYKNHRWCAIDSGTTLRAMISKEVHDIYSNRIRSTINVMHTLDRDDEKWKNLQNLSNKMSDICVLLKKTPWKNNIMRESKEIFYDGEFVKKIDTNPYLLCFNNGVVDFKNRIFRKGQPDDYLTKCTNIDYHAKRDPKIVNEINKFMEELFPVSDLRKYMWDFLASCLIGTNENQTFNIWTGTGANGKSILVELMSRCLGEYKGVVPLPLITKERINIGSASPELAQLIGVRLGVMSEPSKNNVINEGPMKELTGGDPLQARALFKDSITFIPQFKLVVCTNTLFDIKSNDDGTWRRIRVCPFESKFLVEPYNDVRYPKEEYQYQFKMDKKLNSKFDMWAPVLMSMLVEIAFERQGIVEDCNKVMAQSDKYRENQDYILEFIKERIENKEGEKITKNNLYEEFKNWYRSNYDNKVPKQKELIDFMDKRFGRAVRTRDNTFWKNVAFICADASDPLDEITNN
jgi:P4 family phage/plasmid primase-like protien